MSELYDMAIERYGKGGQIVVCMEEMAELTKELSKAIRGEKNTEQIIEEVADVYFMLDQVKYMFHIDDVEIENIIKFKAERLEKRLKDEKVN